MRQDECKDNLNLVLDDGDETEVCPLLAGYIAEYEVSGCANLVGVVFPAELLAELEENCPLACGLCGGKFIDLFADWQSGNSPKGGYLNYR